MEKQFTNKETAKRWEPAEDFNWNRLIHVPGLWKGNVKDIPPNVVEKLIEQGRKDFIPVNNQDSVNDLEA